jgi:hypothetical protein
MSIMCWQDVGTVIQISFSCSIFWEEFTSNVFDFVVSQRNIDLLLFSSEIERDYIRFRYQIDWKSM